MMSIALPEKSLSNQALHTMIRELTEMIRLADHRDPETIKAVVEAVELLAPLWFVHELQKCDRSI